MLNNIIIMGSVRWSDNAYAVTIDYKIVYSIINAVTTYYIINYNYYIAINIQYTNIVCIFRSY